MIADYADPLAKVGSKSFGGIRVYTNNLGYQLSLKGIEVDLFTRCSENSDGPEVVVINSKFKVYRIKIGEERVPEFYTENLKKYITKTLKIIKDQHLKYNLIHANHWFSGLAGAEISHVLHIPLVESFHSLGAVRLNVLNGFDIHTEDELMAARIRAERKLADQLKSVIASSLSEKDFLINSYGLTDDQIKIIPIGVDKNMFYPVETAAARRILGLPKQDPILLYVGVIKFTKGLETLLYGYKKVLNQLPKAKLYIVGGDEPSSPAAKKQFTKDSDVINLKKLCKKLKIEKSVYFLGSIEQSRLYMYYSMADVCVVPSYYETFGIVPIESMACGTPVVASDVGGLKYTVANGEVGFRFKTESAQDLSRKINMVLLKGKNSFTKACLKRIDSYYNWEDIAGKYIEYYKLQIPKRYSILRHLMHPGLFR